MLGKTEGKRRMGWQRMRWFESIINSVDMNLSKLQEIVKHREAWHAAVHGTTNRWTRLSGLNNNKGGVHDPPASASLDIVVVVV